jgi:YHS domain-containing protein
MMLSKMTAIGFTGVLFAASSLSAQTDESAKHTAQVEQFLAQSQKICPVSGKDLSSMGGPVKATIEGQTVFLCCKGCLGKPVNPKHWKAVQSNLAMARLALAQKICPVSGEDLLSMGGPVASELNGQAVFLCCEGCLKQPAEPKAWAQVQSNLMAAQQVCPVTKKKLGADAVPVVVKKREVFVCCKDCVKKVQSDPDNYVALVDGLLAKSLQKTQAKK